MKASYRGAGGKGCRKGKKHRSGGIYTRKRPIKGHDKYRRPLLREAKYSFIHHQYTIKFQKINGNLQALPFLSKKGGRTAPAAALCVPCVRHTVHRGWVFSLHAHAYPSICRAGRPRPAVEKRMIGAGEGQTAGSCCRGRPLGCPVVHPRRTVGDAGPYAPLRPAPPHSASPVSRSPQ